MPAWSPDGRSIVYATWTTTGGHIKRVAADGGQPRNADAAAKATTSTPPTRRMDRASCSWPGAASDQLYSILMDTPPEDEREGDEHAPREIGGVNPPNTLEIRWMPAAGGAGDARGVGAGRTRAALRAQRFGTRVYFTTNRGLQSITMDGYDRRTHAAHHRHRARATTRRARTTSGCRPTARARSSACRASTTSSPCRAPGARPWKCASRAARDNTAVPVKRDVARGRRLPRLDRRRQEP